MLIIYPPAIAGGTDCIQQCFWTFEAKRNTLGLFECKRRLNGTRRPC